MNFGTAVAMMLVAFVVGMMFGLRAQHAAGWIVPHETKAVVIDERAV